jgi:CheY-like chemotaxis protein
MRILVVGDNEPIAELISAFLKREGDFQVESEVDGDTAFQHYCEHGPYDLVVTDLFHPGMDGLVQSRAIRKKNPKQAIAAFTANGSKPIRYRFQRLHIPLLEKGELRPAVEIVQFLKDAIATKQKTKKRATVRARRRARQSYIPLAFSEPRRSSKENQHGRTRKNVCGLEAPYG